MWSHPDSFSPFLSSFNMFLSLSLSFIYTSLPPCLHVCVFVKVKGFVALATELVGPSQRQRSLAEFSHTVTEWDGLLTHTMGSAPSHSHTHAHTQSHGSSLTRHYPPLLPSWSWVCVWVCVFVFECPNGLSDAPFSPPCSVRHTCTHTHTENHLTHLLAHTLWPIVP